MDATTEKIYVKLNINMAIWKYLNEYLGILMYTKGKIYLLYEAKWS